MKYLLLSLNFILIVLTYSCLNKDATNIEKKINYNVSVMIYKGEYEKALKYIDSVTFNDKLSKDYKNYLDFKQAEINYLYLNKAKDAYEVFKKIFKNKLYANAYYKKLLLYLLEISSYYDDMNYNFFLKKLFDEENNKETFYKYFNYLKDKKEFKKAKELINKADTSNDEKIYLLLDIMIVSEKDKEKILSFIDKNLKKVKNQRIKDKMKIEKLLILESLNKLDFKLGIDILKTIKTEDYKEFVKNKERFYKKQILLYNKK